MNTLLKLLLNAAAVFILAYALPGIGVDNYVTAIIVALVLALLNLLIKPLLIVLTLPITIVSLGLFLFVINGFIILLADKFINGFYANNIWWAIGFSILLSMLQSFLQSFLKKSKK